MFGIQQLKVENGSVMWNRLDMTSAVDWALKNNYLSVMWTFSPFLWWWTSPVCTTGVTVPQWWCQVARGFCFVGVIDTGVGMCVFFRKRKAEEEELEVERQEMEKVWKKNYEVGVPSLLSQTSCKHTHSPGLLSFFFWWKVFSIKLRLKLVFLICWIPNFNV